MGYRLKSVEEKHTTEEMVGLMRVRTFKEAIQIAKKYCVTYNDPVLVINGNTDEILCTAHCERDIVFVSLHIAGGLDLP
jgi:hypothetical protein